MAIDPRDIGELQKALNDASAKASALWTTFVTFALYLAISFGSVTHRDLFLENPVKLPLLNVDLPLTAFFAVAPVVFVIFHFYVCLQMFGLARRAAAYNTLLRDETDGEAERQIVRQRVDLFLVAQFLAGPRVQRVGLVGLSLRFVAWVTLVAAPVAVLLVAQLTFLPYHAAPVTWVQRLCLLVDLAIIWFFWKRIRDGDDRLVPRLSPKVWEGIGIATTALIAWFSVGVAYFPGEVMERVGLDRVPFSYREDGRSTRLSDVIFTDDIDHATSRARRLFANRIVLPGRGFANDATSGTGRAAALPSFAGRDLSHAILDRIELPKADFSGADLRHARLVEAHLDEAKFLFAHLDDVDARWATFTEANFALASLDRGLLFDATFAGARFAGTRLHHARLYRSDLTGAGFYHASLKGAQFNGARLVGTLLLNSDLRGASFVGARLIGSHFSNSCLDLTIFHRARLDGVVIDIPRRDELVSEDWFKRDLQLGQRTSHPYLNCTTDRPIVVDFSQTVWNRSLFRIMGGRFMNWDGAAWTDVPFDQKTFGASKAGIVALLNTDRRAVANRQLEMLAPELLVYRAPPIAAGDAASAITSDGAAPAETVDEGASFLAKDICDDTPKDKDIDSSEPSPALAVAYLSYWFVDAKRLLGQEINIPGIAADQKADLLHSHFTNHPKLTADFIGHFLFSQECQATRERLEERLRANVWEEAGILGKVVDLARPATSSPTPSPSPPAK